MNLPGVSPRAAFITLLGLLALAVGGCGKGSSKRQPGQPAEVPASVALQADNLASDATFAVQIHDFARAADSMTKSLELRSDVPDRWEVLAYAHKKLGSIDDARSDFKKALKLWKQYFDETKNPRFGMRQVYILFFLRRFDEASDLADKLAKQFPNDDEVQGFRRANGIEYMKKDPEALDKQL